MLRKREQRDAWGALGALGALVMLLPNTRAISTILKDFCTQRMEGARVVSSLLPLEHCPHTP